MNTSNDLWNEYAESKEAMRIAFRRLIQLPFDATVGVLRRAIHSGDERDDYEVYALVGDLLASIGGEHLRDFIARARGHGSPDIQEVGESFDAD